jgi:thioredoxin 1
MEVLMEITITKENFEAEVLKSEVPVLLDFWAPWCGPCMMLGPVLEEIAKENAGTLKVGKVNVDDEMELAMQFGVTSIPLLVLMKDGKIANKALGYMPKAKVEALFK